MSVASILGPNGRIAAYMLPNEIQEVPKIIDKMKLLEEGLLALKAELVATKELLEQEEKARREAETKEAERKKTFLQWLRSLF
jgi:hypothetical protein